MKDEASSQEFNVRQKKKPVPRKPAVTPDADLRNARKRRNAWDPQVVVPQQVDLPLKRAELDEVVIPAAPNGRSLINGRF